MKKRISLIALVILVLSGCTNLSQLKKMDANLTNPFNRTLAEEYLNFAENEAAQYDWHDSEYFAKKGIRAASGKDVAPENWQDWGISKKHRKEVEWAFSRLQEVLRPNIKISHPKRLAKIQFLYDCWLEQQEEGWQKEDIESCRMNYLMELNSLENDIFGTPKASMPEPKMPEIKQEVKKEAPKKSIMKDYTILFSFGSSEVNVKETETIEKVVNIVNDMKEYIVKLSGHTDTVGPKAFNKELSKQRADSVANQLRKRGVEIKDDDIHAYGEENLAVKTKDGVASKANRRVEINIKGH